MIRPLIAAALAIGITAPAFAASDQFRMKIDYNRAALDAPATAQAEYDRIKSDVTERCAKEQADIGLATPIAIRFCEKRTMDRVDLAIDHPAFTALHRADYSK
ncbi:MAG TPA: UrcA family protein [Hyphomonas sp.]|nr:UrcA family protein [Hyphomonas sp.]